MMDGKAWQQQIVVCGVPFGTEREKEALANLRSVGVTSVQIYTFWNQFEPAERGGFDWAHYDRQVDLIRDAGLKYVPFLLLGPRYAAPDWWLASPGHVGLYCLEHGKYNPIESIWNPAFRDEISRVVDAFSAHYGADILESVQPGICGDYGESIMPVHGNWPGSYHTHGGYWCGGDDAVAHLRSWLRTRFGTVQSLNAAWRSHYSGLDEVRPFLPHKAPSRTAYFDLLDWYRESMTEFVDFWMRECRRAFPDLPLYMCTGGIESPEHASLFSEQAKVCARYAGGLRLTNECNKFYENFLMTAYTRSACDHYGAYLGLEPVGPMTDKGVVVRTFGSAAYGNPQIFHYVGNLTTDGASLRPAAHAVGRYRDLIAARPLPESVAVFWPGYYSAWVGGGIADDVREAVSFVRRRTDCLPVNEHMILDGALDRHKLLVIPIAGFTRPEVLLRIADWVRDGGVVLSTGLTRDLELEPVAEYDALFGVLPDSENAAGISSHFPDKEGPFAGFAALETFTSSHGWMGLAEDVVPLAGTKPHKAMGPVNTERVCSVFMRRAGAGTAILFDGPVSFADDPEALFRDPGAYPTLLGDVLDTFAHTRDLTPAAGEVARAEIGGVLYALGDGEIHRV